jgi:DNA-binding response OmpR family regulator
MSSPTKAATNDLHGYRVLIVEDNYLIARDLSDALQSRGATVLGPSPDAQGGRRLAQHQRPDCALLDINLSGEMVFEFAKELRSQRINTIFTTGYDAAFLPAGLNNMPCVQKPVNFDALASLIRDSGSNAMAE